MSDLHELLSKFNKKGQILNQQRSDNDWHPRMKPGKLVSTTSILTVSEPLTSSCPAYPPRPTHPREVHIIIIYMF